MPRSGEDANEKATKRPPATTPQGRENELIALAYDEAEKVMRSGKATSQLLTHFLKLGTEKEKLERAKLEKETLLLQSRVDSIATELDREEGYQAVVRAMTQYKGLDDEEDQDYAY